MKTYNYFILSDDCSGPELTGQIQAHDRDHALLKLGAKYYNQDVRKVFLEPLVETQYAPQEVNVRWN